MLGYDAANREASEKIRQYYFPDVKDIASKDYISAYTNLFSDRQFFVPVHHFVQQFMKQAPVRMYLYSYQAEFSLGDILAATQNERLPVVVSVFWDVVKRWISRTVLRHEIPHLGVCHGKLLKCIYHHV